MRSILSLSGTEFVAALVLRSLAWTSASIIVLIFLFLFWESGPALAKVGADTWGGGGWFPGEDNFDLGPIIAGSLVLTLGAVVWSFPLAVSLAIAIRFYLPPLLSGLLKSCIELTAGIPSVVFGFWALTRIVPEIGRLNPEGSGQVLVTGILVLGFMMIPIGALGTEAALSSVPAEYLKAATALGLPRSRTVFQVALPCALPGIAAAFVLQATRALGETMAVLMVSGNVAQIPGNLFQPVRALTANIALEMGYASGLHRSALFASGLLLFAVVALFVMGTGYGFRRSR